MRAATLNSANNGDGVVVQEGSVMTVFNTPQLWGVSGFSTLNVQSNTGNGIRVLTGVDACRDEIRPGSMSKQNSRTGLIADNGVGITLVNATITGNIDEGSSTDVRRSRRFTDDGVRHLYMRRDRAGARHQRDRVPALGSVYDITLKMASR